MTEAKIEKGTEKVYRVTCIAKGGKPGSSTLKPMHVYNNCGNVQRNTEEAGNESTSEPQSLSPTSTPSSNSSQLF